MWFKLSLLFNRTLMWFLQLHYTCGTCWTYESAWKWLYRKVNKVPLNIYIFKITTLFIICWLQLDNPCYLWWALQHCNDLRSPQQQQQSHYFCYAVKANLVLMALILEVLLLFWDATDLTRLQRSDSVIILYNLLTQYIVIFKRLKGFLLLLGHLKRVVTCRLACAWGYAEKACVQ